ncbi:site-specific integrase, partial [Pseudonocardia tropica]
RPEGVNPNPTSGGQSQPVVDIRHAMARDKVMRNVVELCSVPTGREGRRSKSLTFTQAEKLLRAAEVSSMRAYVVLSLLTGARTEELRALRWEDVDLVGSPGEDPPVPPSISVLRSVRMDGDTKTRRSRRRLAMPSRAVRALAAHAERPEVSTGRADLVFASPQRHGVGRAQRSSIVPTRCG